MTPLSQYRYGDGDLALTGWVAQPVNAPRAAIAIFPTIANITPRVAEKAQSLADAGYLVMVADYYGEAVADFDHALNLGRNLRTDTQIYRKRLHCALNALQAMPAAAGLPMGAIGFCMGGQAVLELARDGAKLDAVTSFHGILETSSPAQPGAYIHPRILICHGDKDPLVPRAHALAFMEEMDKTDADWHLHIYAHARHGFTDPASDKRGADTLAYHLSADRQSWSAMLTFFDEAFP